MWFCATQKLSHFLLRMIHWEKSSIRMNNKFTTILWVNSFISSINIATIFFFFFGVNSIIFNSLRSILLSILYSRSIFFFVFKFHRRSNKFVFVTANRRKQTELSQNIYRHIPKWMRRGNNHNNNKNATANTLDRFRLHSANRQILYFECGEITLKSNTNTFINAKEKD